MEVNIDFCPGGYWLNQSNRLQFFNSFAKEKGFDPRTPSNWYSAPRNEIMDRKVFIYWHNSIIVLLIIIIGCYISAQLLWGKCNKGTYWYISRYRIGHKLFLFKNSYVILVRSINYIFSFRLFFPPQLIGGKITKREERFLWKLQRNTDLMLCFPTIGIRCPLIIFSVYR